jgi:flavin reductase (DIM6/NTAB) family NADH-FMN oxidoreductase RutF
MNKIKLNPNVAIPMPVTIVGAKVAEKANFMAVGWVARVNYQPPMIGIGLSNRHHTTKGIHESKVFSVCIPGEDLLEKADYCGIVSGREVDKSLQFTVFYGETGAPLITECPVCIECRLVQAIELPSNTWFIGEIIGVFSEEKFLTGNNPDVFKIHPLLLSMPDNTYWKLGAQAGKAWKDGLKLKK